MGYSTEVRAMNTETISNMETESNMEIVSYNMKTVSNIESTSNMETISNMETVTTMETVTNMETISFGMLTTPCYSEFNDTNLTTGLNASQIPEELPEEMRFGTLHVVSIAAYSSFFVIAASGNLTVFITLFRNRKIKSRVNMFIMHLSIADLLVTFIMMPLEIFWHVTVEWRAGDVGCRILMFFRTFGLYLSSFVLVVISLDRYFAIIHPLSLNDADKRGKIMLVFAWLFSVAASIPQSVIFHVEAHPDHSWFKQCVTFNFFPTPTHELVYNFFNMIAMYGLPLIVITLSYTLILKEISRKTRQSKEELQELNSTKTRGRLRRSAVGNIERARSRTLKMTIVIVSVFVFCWTPYFVLAVWWWFDSDTAKQLDPRIQKGLFMFAVSNTCMNPIVYGLFTINLKRELVRCCACLKSEWGHKKFLSNGTQIGREYTQKSLYVRTSYSSVRSSATSTGIKINLEKLPNCKTNPTVRFEPNKYERGKVSVRLDLPQEPSDGSTKSESRVNLNNFIAVQLPIHDTPTSL